MTVTAALLLGALIGISLGALGGGGSILTVPALVYVLGDTAHAATTSSLVIVGITSAVATVGYARSGNVRWTVGLVFGLVGVAASYAGTAVNRQLDPNALLLAFAALMLVSAVAMLIRSVGATPAVAASPDPEPGSAGPTTAHGTATATATRTSVTSARRQPRPAVVAKVVAAGLAVGFLTGFLGVGGGFIIVPALVMALEFPMAVAVGTSLLVIAVNCAAALVARAGDQTFHWAVIIPFTLAAVAGSVGGKQIADRASGATLTRAFAGLLLAVGAYTAIRSGIGLL